MVHYSKENETRNYAATVLIWCRYFFYEIDDVSVFGKKLKEELLQANTRHRNGLSSTQLLVSIKPELTMLLDDTSN